MGQISAFVVRVEHDRGWEIPRHADWPTDPVSGRHYKEFPLTLTGDQRTVVGAIEILDNGLIDPENWMYSAQIKPLEDTDANPLEPLKMQVRAWEPNLRMADGTNSTVSGTILDDDLYLVSVRATSLRYHTR